MSVPSGRQRDAGDVDVAVGAEVHPGGFAGGDVDHAQLDERVRRPGERVAVVFDFHARPCPGGRSGSRDVAAVGADVGDVGVPSSFHQKPWSRSSSSWAMNSARPLVRPSSAPDWSAGRVALAAGRVGRTNRVRRRARRRRACHPRLRRGSMAPSHACDLAERGIADGDVELAAAGDEQHRRVGALRPLVAGHAQFAQAGALAAQLLLARQLALPAVDAGGGPASTRRSPVAMS